MPSHICLWGKSPEKQSISSVISRKATDFKHGGTVEDGEKDLYERPGPSSELSTPSQSTLWLHQDGLFSIKALEGEDMSSLVARKLSLNIQPFVAHRQSYAIVDSFGIFNTMGLTLSQRTIFPSSGTWFLFSISIPILVLTVSSFCYHYPL